MKKSSYAEAELKKSAAYKIKRAYDNFLNPPISFLIHDEYFLCILVKIISRDKFKSNRLKSVQLLSLEFLLKILFSCTNILIFTT